jgi:hypothetical protein
LSYPDKGRVIEHRQTHVATILIRTQTCPKKPEPDERIAEIKKLIVLGR